MKAAASEQMYSAMAAISSILPLGKAREAFAQGVPLRTLKAEEAETIAAMGDALVRGHRIEIRGFGSFSVTRRPPRVGRNPRSGESVQIPEKRVPHFKPGKALREAVEREQ